MPDISVKQIKCAFALGSPPFSPIAKKGICLRRQHLGAKTGQFDPVVLSPLVCRLRPPEQRLNAVGTQQECASPNGEAQSIFSGYPLQCARTKDAISSMQSSVWG